MATIKMLGMAAYIRALSGLEKAVKDKVIGAAVYRGAGIVADMINEGISSYIPIDNAWGTESNPATGLNAKQKAGLHIGLGISDMRDDYGFLNVKIGFDGYNDIHTKRWPWGQPNEMVARSAERGTSWLKPTKFIKKSVGKAMPQVLKEMGRVVDEQIRAIMGDG